MIEPLLPECDHFTGRKRAICRGEANLPLDGQNSINAYRVHWGLDPILREDRPVGSRQHVLTTAERAASLARVAADTARRAITTGRGLLAPEQIEARYAACRACECLQADGHCTLCGCGCSGARKLANKLAHPASVCPHDPPQWGPVE